MNNKSSKEINIFRDLLRRRRHIKKLQQLSWDSDQLNRKFPVEEASEQDMTILKEAYEDILDQVIQLAEEIENE